MGGFPLVHALLAALVDDAAGVAHDDMVFRHAHRLDQFGAGDARGPGAVDHDLRLADRAAGQVERVYQSGRHDDRGAVLIVVKNRDVEEFAQLLFDNETVRRLDVFEIYPAKTRPEIADAVDEGVDIVGVDFQVDRIDIGKALEQDGLALHHRLRRQRAQVAEAENGRAVGDDAHQVAARRVVVGGARVFRDAPHRRGDAGRIGQRQVPLGRQRFGRRDLDLARPPGGVHQQGFPVGDVFGVGHGGAGGRSGGQPRLYGAAPRLPIAATVTPPKGVPAGKDREPISTSGASLARIASMTVEPLREDAACPRP